MDDKRSTVSESGDKGKKRSAFEFTKDEYYGIVHLIIAGDQEGYDRLIRKAEKNISRFIEANCYKAKCPSVADDAKQRTYLRLFLKFMTNYVYAKDDGEINPDYRGLSAWIKKVAFNATLDEISKYNEYYVMMDWSYFEEDDSSEESERPKKEIADTNPTPETLIVEREARTEKLKKCVDVVISSRNAVYKVLTWLGHRAMIYKYGCTNIEANKRVLEEFSDRTFYEIYDYILMAAEDVEWLQLSRPQRDRIEAELAKTVDGKAMGYHTLREHFMASGEDKTISDWRNRIDDLLRKNDDLKEYTEPADDKEDKEENK